MPCHATSHQGHVIAGTPSPWLPLFPSFQVPPAPFSSRSAFVPLGRFSSVLFSPCPLSLCACTSPLLSARGASLSFLLSLIWALSLTASLILFLPQPPFSPQLVRNGDQEEIRVGTPSGLKGVFFERHLSTPPVKVEVRLAG